MVAFINKKHAFFGSTLIQPLVKRLGYYSKVPILVMHDLLGISTGYIPKFSKNYLAITGDIHSAVKLYKQEVREQTFPAAEHTFN